MSSLAAIFLVVWLITGSIQLSLFVLLCVAQTNFFLCGLIPLVGLTFNNVVVIYLINSLGLSVLYSMQISHTFLNVDAPVTFVTKQQRQFKSRVALARMGPSILHGAVATFIAIALMYLDH